MYMYVYSCSEFLLKFVDYMVNDNQEHADHNLLDVDFLIF